MKVDIETQRTAEALHDRRRATAAIRDALSPGAATADEVLIRKVGDDVILSPRPKDWPVMFSPLLSACCTA